MRNSLSKLAFTAALGFAITFTFSCSSGGGGDEQSYKYCITSDYGCLPGPFTASNCNGQLSNSCPNGSSPGGGSSSSGDGTSAGISSGTFTDVRDGKPYKWVKIGSQTWMAKNLNYAADGSKCYGEGGEVSTYDQETDTDIYTTLSNAEIQANCSIYGRLYDWTTAMALPSNCNSNSCSSQINAKHRGICPSGWHIPSDAEWSTLTSYVGSSAGTKLKATSGWNSNGNGTDEFEFAALPGGGSDGVFRDVGDYGVWWSATEDNARDAYIRIMIYYSEDVRRDEDYKNYLFSVRCVQD
jgi:uncharacterized protein (TIGR02145 family)